MDSYKKVEPAVSDVAADLRAISRHAPKLVALKLRVPVGTAHEWLYRRLPDARRKEVAAVLLAECARLERLIADTRRRWGDAADEANGDVDGRTAAEAGPPHDRVGK